MDFPSFKLIYPTQPPLAVLLSLFLSPNNPQADEDVVIQQPYTMEQPPVQIGQYVLGKNLGIGAFGKVRLAVGGDDDQLTSLLWP